MKKFFILILALIFTGTFLFAGGGTQQSVGGKPVISVSMLDRGQVSAAEGTYENNRWTRWINENAPVHVNFVPVPRTESTARLTALFAAGTAPDVVWEFGKGFLDNLYTQGVIQPVGDHIRNYSTVYRDYLAAHPELLPFLMGVDGQQYGMTTARNILNIPNHAMWIRQDWLDRFNMPLPTTTDQVLNFMRRARDTDASGMGTYGLTFNFNWVGIINALFGQPMDNFMIVNGRFVDWTTTDGYRESLAFRALLYREGLIDPEYITDTNYIRQRELLVTGRSAIHMGSWNQPAEWRELRQNVPTSNWMPFEPWTTSQGKQGLFQEPPAHYMILMNAQSRNARDIMAYADWMMDDNWWTLAYGHEGVHYRLVNGVPQTIDVDRNNIEMIYSGEYAIFHQNQPQLYWFPLTAAQDPLSQAYVPIMQLANEIQLRNRYTRLPYTATSDNIRRFSTEVGPQITALETSIITGRLSVDEGLRQINDYKRSFGWDAVSAERDEWYQANRHLLY